MTLFSNSLTAENGQLILAAALAVAGFFLLLPRPRGRVVAGGIASLLGAVAVFAAWLHRSFGNPAPDVIGSVLFCLFAGGALVFGSVLVVQRNPARGAIAFAFVILSTCGLFLMLAAPFLMAATIIIYAGAIIVTFLFVLMLSHADGPSDENDRSREPLLGSLAGFAFAGLILFALFLSKDYSSTVAVDARLPAPVMTVEDRTALRRIVDRLNGVEGQLGANPRPTNVALAKELTEIESELEAAIGTPSGSDGSPIKEGAISMRLRARGEYESATTTLSDPQAAAMKSQLNAIRTRARQAFRSAENEPPFASEANRLKAKQSLGSLRDEVRLLAGSGELPARNVGTIGLTLFSEHLLEVELAGTLLLIATIGAIAIAQRKGAAP